MNSTWWIGIDADSDAGCFAFARKRPFTSFVDSFAATRGAQGPRPDGGRTIAALPPAILFAERIDLPPRASRDIVKGQLDVRLPVPVEDCLVLAGPRPKGGSSSLMAYAVTRENFRSFLASFQARFGFEPERVVPAAEVLWREVSSSLPDTPGCAIHLHASGSTWILLSGDRERLVATVSVPKGDVAAAARNAAILALRQKQGIVSFSLSGNEADEALARALSSANPAPPCAVKVVPSPGEFLAVALAREGALRDLAPEGNFRDDSIPHPAATRRLLGRALCAALPLLLLGFLAIGLALGECARARRAIAAAHDDLTAVSSRLAGRPLPVTGAAALEMARNEFDQRLNPVIVALMDSYLFDSMALPLELSLTRNLTFSSLQFDGQMARFEGKAITEDDLAIWRRRAQESGLALAVESAPSEDGAGLQFSATQFRQEVP